jgi:hypothetical protein
MVILRPTRKIRQLDPAPLDGSVGSDTALGDWYANRIVISRQPPILLVSSLSLLPILTPARGVRSLPTRLPSLVEDRLQRLLVPTGLIERESGAMSPVAVARTTDRSVLGTMVDFATMLPHMLPPGRWGEEALPALEAQLGRSPCRVSRPKDAAFFPDQKATELLLAKWQQS